MQISPSNPISRNVPKLKPPAKSATRIDSFALRLLLRLWISEAAAPHIKGAAKYKLQPYSSNSSVESFAAATTAAAVIAKAANAERNLSPFMVTMLPSGEAIRR